jgi:hypothetical protein
MHSIILINIQPHCTRCEFEAVAIEIEPLMAELNFALKHIDEWARPVLTPSPALVQPSLSEYIYEPFGVW